MDDEYGFIQFHSARRPVSACRAFLRARGPLHTEPWLQPCALATCWSLRPRASIPPCLTPPGVAVVKEEQPSCRYVAFQD